MEGETPEARSNAEIHLEMMEREADIEEEGLQ